jgi:hypothetical protein
MDALTLRVHGSFRSWAHGLACMDALTHKHAPTHKRTDAHSRRHHSLPSSLLPFCPIMCPVAGALALADAICKRRTGVNPVALLDLSGNAPLSSSSAAQQAVQLGYALGGGSEGEFCCGSRGFGKPSLSQHEREGLPTLASHNKTHPQSPRLSHTAQQQKGWSLHSIGTVSAN